MHFGVAVPTRFGSPDAAYGVLYLASDPACAFIETFGQATGQNTVTARSLSERMLTRVESRRPLMLVDLTGAGLAHVGADARLATGDHTIARAWAAAFWRHPSRPDGIFYRARHDPSRFALALYDQTATVLRAVVLGGWLDPHHATLLRDILESYRFGLHQTAESGRGGR